MLAEILPAKYDHIPFIAEGIREADRQEIWDMALMRPLEALVKSLADSRIAWTGKIDGEPMCMFGVAGVSSLSEVGRPWLLGTDKIDKHATVFLRHNKWMIKTMLVCYRRLENYVAESNEKSIQWLKWMDFQFGEPEPMGAFKKSFIRFWMEA